MKDNHERKQAMHIARYACVTGGQKGSYSSPVLRFYGSVSSLTHGSNSCDLDHNNTQTPTQNNSCKSDRRCKENLLQVGVHPQGINLYLFNFKPEFRDACGHGWQFGVMADEVEKVMPEAISTHSDGYKMVNYAMLGISHNLH